MKLMCFIKKFEVPDQRQPIFCKTRMIRIYRKITISVILETSFTTLPLFSEFEMT